MHRMCTVLVALTLLPQQGICRESPFTVRHFTVLKLGGEQLKKVEVLRLQRLLRSASTLWKD